MKIKCQKCSDIIESKHRHDMVFCSCKAIAIDGGRDYTKITGNPDNVIYLDDKEDWELIEDWSVCNQDGLEQLSDWRDSPSGLCPPSIFTEELLKEEKVNE